MDPAVIENGAELQLPLVELSKSTHVPLRAKVYVHAAGSFRFTVNLSPLPLSVTNPVFVLEGGADTVYVATDEVGEFTGPGQVAYIL